MFILRSRRLVRTTLNAFTSKDALKMSNLGRTIKKFLRIFGALCIVQNPLSANECVEDSSLRIFSYHELTASRGEIIGEFYKKGYIAVQGIPKFYDAYKNFIRAARNFTALGKTERNHYTPLDGRSCGWWEGTEKLNGVQETYKASYYAWLPEQNALPNIWPDIPDFEGYYKGLSEIMFKIGQEILSLIESPSLGNQGLGRMLYYSLVYSQDNNPHWCGLHRDHGLFTVLCPEVYVKEGVIVPKPQGSGLYITDKEISLPCDVLLFQIGEVMEMITNGKMRATEHFVKKAIGGFERYAFAFFCDPPSELIIECNDPQTLEIYKDRYTPRMTYQEWNDRSIGIHSL